MEKIVKLSLFCSSIRPHLWDSLFKSLEGTTEEVEFVFGGPLKEKPAISSLDEGYINGNIYYTSNYEKDNLRDFRLRPLISFKYIFTADIKPAQIYEACRRECTGELISWTCDDAEFPNDVLGKEYRFFKTNCGYKDVLSVETMENYGSWQKCDINHHKFFADSAKAPKMAPMGVVNRQYFQELGGIDRRYICGQWDNDLLMRMYNDGAKIQHFGETPIWIDHLNKHDKRWGISAGRPFGQGYQHDRNILEGSWGKRGQMRYDVFPYDRYDAGFEPFEDTELLTKSQSFTNKELWND